MKLDKFRKGVRVVYVPTHAHQDLNHPDCEYGVVSSINDKFVFVKFDIEAYTNIDGKPWTMQMMTGDEDYTAQACDPRDLFTEEETEFIKGV